MKQAARKRQSPLMVVVIVLAVVVAVLFAAAAYRINDAAQGYAVDYSARDYRYAAVSGRYGMLYDTAIQDMSKKARYTAEVEEYRALAFYYEQAVLEHAYRVAGDTGKADAFAERMQEYEAQLGSMADRAESVRTAVGS